MIEDPTEENGKDKEQDCLEQIDNRCEGVVGARHAHLSQHPPKIGVVVAFIVILVHFYDLGCDWRLDAKQH